MANCYIMVGLPASGKSTRVAQLCRMYPDAFVYSTDAYIEECAKINGLTYDQAFSEFIDPATKRMNEQLDIAIRSNQTIIWDQTNLGIKKRAKIINRMRQAGYWIYCECFTIPETEEDFSEWNRRLQGRPGKTIPEHVIQSMTTSYVIPTLEEGFASIKYRTISGVFYE